MTIPSRKQLLDTLRRFAEASGEVPDQHWSLGWGTDHIHGEHAAAPATITAQGADS